jgi:hypothetical protein
MTYNATEAVYDSLSRKGRFWQSSIPLRTNTAKFVAFQFFCLIYFQRFGVSAGSEQISVSQLAITATIAYMAWRYDVTLAASRLLLFTATITSIFVSQTLVAGSLSVTSVAFMIALYGLFCFVWRIDAEEYLAIQARYVSYMFIPAAMVYIQYVYQLVMGTGQSFGLNIFVPESLLLKGYMYEGSTENWVVWNRPNGFFFLEPSFCSLFLAYTVWLEARYFRRPWLIAFFIGALILTNGATGLLAIFVTAAAYYWRSPALFMVLCLSVAVTALLTIFDVQINLLPRVDELSNSGSSGYGRLVLPFTSFAGFFFDPSYWFTGNGAGRITMEYGSPWPLLKLSYEYGVLPALLWIAFFVFSVAGRVNGPFRLGLFVVFQFTGGYLLSPIMVLLTYLTCTWFQIIEKRDGIE